MARANVIALGLSAVILTNSVRMGDSVVRRA